MKTMAMLLSISIGFLVSSAQDVLDLNAFRNALDNADICEVEAVYKKHENFQGLSMEQKRSAYMLLHAYAQKIVKDYEGGKMLLKAFKPMKLHSDAAWVFALAIKGVFTELCQLLFLNLHSIGKMKV